MIFGLLYFCVVNLCVNRSRTSFILYRIVKRHSRQSNVRRIWTCADNVASLALSPHLLLCKYLLIVSPSVPMCISCTVFPHDTDEYKAGPT